MTRTRKTTTRRPRKATAGRSPMRTASREPAPATPPERLTIGKAVRRALSLITMTALFAALVGLFVIVVTQSTQSLDVALDDDTGASGTATVVSCESHTTGSGRSRRTRHDCEARFVFDDPSKEPIVIDTIPEVEVGEIFPAALTPEGDRVLPTGARGVWWALLVPAGIAFGLAAVVFLGALMTGSRKLIIWTGALGLPFLIVLIIAVVAGT
ncbi:hypothetical protein ACSDR0_41310 [Streptosporangium sp. G11]|uniref:hypothetical protein n=1 Tax=Streptosporangium sp. G11 TaxID=3436926 RepID=UPI003EBCB658